MSKEEPFEGFEHPTKNYYHTPNNWTDICAEIDNLAELKIVQYVMRHTWGYQEYGVTKTITTDEFLHGRKRNDGSRIDKGTGLKSDRSVKDGIKAAIEHGYLICEVDKTDKARVKKSYALKMAPRAESGQVASTHQEDDRGVETTHQSGRNYPSGGTNLPIGGTNTTHRSEKDTGERHLQKDTLERPASQTRAELIQLEEQVDTKLEQIEQQQERFWSLWCHVWFNKDIPPKLTERAQEHVAKLAPHIATTEQLESLIEHTKKDLLESQGIKRKTVQLGNLVNSYSGWKQTQRVGAGTTVSGYSYYQKPKSAKVEVD